MVAGEPFVRVCEFIFLVFKKYSYLCILDMTKYNPNMTLHKLFLNIKKRDVYALL